jgi:hypothetical protein
LPDDGSFTAAIGDPHHHDSEYCTLAAAHRIAISAAE